MEKERLIINTPNAKKNKGMTININQLDSLKELSRSLPRELHKIFISKYGNILDLLCIPVDASALNVLAQYWNPSLRCFELPNLDITPTIEEYACMLGLPIQKNMTVYFHFGHHLTNTRIAELLGVSINQVKLTGHANSRGLTRAYLETYLSELERQQEWETFMRVLALTIYGLTLFPSAPNMVDQAAMDVFFMVHQKEVNPVPAVLAETFLTLNFCHQKQKGKLRCSAHLLYVWIITHMYTGNHLKNSSDPLKEFHRISLKKCGELEWKDEFDKLDSRSFKWVCPWYKSKEVILSCGNFPNVPLMGPRGCVSYTPVIVLRQLCWTQGEPREEQLGGCYFWHDDNENIKKLAKEVRNAWGNIQMAGRPELGKPLVIHTREYLAWRAKRRGCNNTPEAVSKNEDNPPSTSQMSDQMKIMKAQIEFLEQQKQDMEMKVIVAQSQCEKMAREIEHLKDECADANEASRTKKGKEKVSGIYKAEIRQLEDKVQVLARERNELRKEVNNQSRVNEELSIEVNDQKQAREALKMEVNRQSCMRRELQQEVENLITAWEQTKADCAQGWALSKQYRSLFIEASNVGKGWRMQALDWEAEIKEWKKKYASVKGELSHYIPNFVRRFEKADEQIRVNPMLSLPSEVDNFMEMCGDFARGLKRKKTRLLM